MRADAAAVQPVVGFAPHRYDRPTSGSIETGTFVLLLVLGFWALAWLRASFRFFTRRLAGGAS